MNIDVACVESDEKCISVNDCLLDKAKLHTQKSAFK